MSNNEGYNIKITSGKALIEGACTVTGENDAFIVHTKETQKVISIHSIDGKCVSGMINEKSFRCSGKSSITLAENIDIMDMSSGKKEVTIESGDENATSSVEPYKIVVFSGNA